jgi:hypothetical protein
MKLNKNFSAIIVDMYLYYVVLILLMDDLLYGNFDIFLML